MKEVIKGRSFPRVTHAALGQGRSHGVGPERTECHAGQAEEPGGQERKVNLRGHGPGSHIDRGKQERRLVSGWGKRITCPGGKLG